MSSAPEPIAAIATAPGRSAIGIVRVSGLHLEALVAKVFRPAHPKARLRDRRPHLGDMLDAEGQVLDQGLLIWFAAPHSYTGEDVLELHCHGNPFILEQLLASLLAAGARAAQPGELTRRAYLNGRLDLVQADAVISLINATSSQSLQAARRLLDGELSERLNGLREQVLERLKWLELEIDFPDEDYALPPREEALSALSALGEAISRLLASYARGRYLREGAKVALCGRANVGKSSLFNRLLGFRRSIVADQPGTTRDLVESAFTLRGVRVTLQDTAGFREAGDGIEAEGMDFARAALRQADLVLLVLDGASPPLAADEALLETVKGLEVPWLALLNKADLGRHAAWEGRLAGALDVSALRGEGLEGVEAALSERLGSLEGADSLMLTAGWQKELLAGALEHVASAARGLAEGLGPEVCAMELYATLDALDSVLGEQGRQEVLDRVFAEFCLGK